MLSRPDNVIARSLISLRSIRRWKRALRKLPLFVPRSLALLLMMIFFLQTGFAAAADPIDLQAGPVSLVFEPDNGLVRYIRVGGYKVLQGINAPVRNQFWGTVPPSVSNVRVTKNSDSFQLAFDVSCREAEIDFSWHGTIRGDANGKVVFTFDGEARSSFLRNRIGFCVLHGPEAAGKACVIDTVDGQTLEGKFPEFISPHQPFKNIRAIKHEIQKGLWAKVRMEGDTFEMEDQRNWTDASFKTYCTPLELPYPVQVASGTRISHRVEVSIEGAERIRPVSNRASGPVLIEVSADRAESTRLPGIGLQVSSQVEQHSKKEIAALRALNLSHLRVHVTSNASVALRRAAKLAEQLEVDLHVCLQLGEKASSTFDSIREMLGEIQQPTRWLLTAATAEQLQAAREFLTETGQRGTLGQGEDTNFTELNRSRPKTSSIEFVSYGLNPQVHAFDNTSMVETLAIQGDTVRTARQFAGELPILISPITLRKQLLDQEPETGELPGNVDPRQPTLFTAAWTLGSIKYLGEAAVESLTYFETVGWLGVMESERGSPLPNRYPSNPGQRYPTWHALRSLAPFAEGEVQRTSSANPMSVIGLTVKKGDKQRLFVVNLTPQGQVAAVEGFGQEVDLRRLDENTFAENVDNPLRNSMTLGSNGPGQLMIELPPYGIAILDRK